jgi:hypothetical protein
MECTGQHDSGLKWNLRVTSTWSSQALDILALQRSNTFSRILLRTLLWVTDIIAWLIYVTLRKKAMIMENTPYGTILTLSTNMAFLKSYALNEHHIRMTYWGNGSTVPRILHHGTRWRWVVSFTPRPPYTQEKSPRGWAPTAGSDAVVKRIPVGTLTPDHPARSPAPYHWAIPAPLVS